jgi:hypothetical protein
MTFHSELRFLFPDRIVPGTAPVNSRGYCGIEDYRLALAEQMPYVLDTLEGCTGVLVITREAAEHTNASHAATQD